MMTDDELEEAIELLHDKIAEATFDVLGSPKAFLTEDSEAFEDFYTIAIHALLSQMANLVSLALHKRTENDQNIEQSIQYVDDTFHKFFHMVMDAGIDGFMADLKAIKDQKLTN